MELTQDMESKVLNFILLIGSFILQQKHCGKVQWKVFYLYYLSVHNTLKNHANSWNLFGSKKYKPGRYDK